MAKRIREIKDKGKVIALIYSKRGNTIEGLDFFTPPNYPLQIGVHEYSKPREVAAHFHPHMKYNVQNTQEFLYAEAGVTEVIIYNRAWQEKTRVKLRAGDFVLFVDCGHEIRFHKGSRVLEVKQGPYPGDKKAKIFRDK